MPERASGGAEPGVADPSVPDADATEDRDDRPRLVQVSLADRRFLMPVEQVREVIVASPPTRLPGSSPAIVGVTSVRGRIVAVVDPRPVLHPSARSGTAGRLVVVDTPDGPVALLVDGVDAVIPADVEPVADADGHGPRCIVGHARVDQVEVAVLDVVAVVAAAVAERRTVAADGEAVGQR
jgi:purine-binding chemotaxis protein CheW